MSLSVTLVGTLVDSARAYDGCIAPRAGGGFNWIKPFYTAPTLVPCEFIINKLEANTFVSCMESGWVAGKAGRYTSINFGPKHQLRAASGRIFMPAASCKTYYYDPVTELVVDMGRIQEPAGGNVPDSSMYSMVFNETGTLLCGGSVAASNTDHRPMVCKIDPVTLQKTFLCRVGSTTRTLNGYAYYLWIVGNWLYVLVGEEVWDIVAVNLTSGIATTLATETVNAWGYMDQVGTKGLTVRLVKNNRMANESTRKWWLIDGALVQYTSDADPVPVHDATPYSNPVPNMPQIDESLLPQHIVKWRPFGSTGAWTSNHFAITYSAPIPVDSLTRLPDGSVHFDVEQYLEVGRISADLVIDNFGAYNQVTEGSARCLYNGMLYWSGYANGPLLVYDPNQPWNPPTNPKHLGYFAPSGTLSRVKRANALAAGVFPPRIYMGGLCDRTASGAGVGYYDIATKKFFGHWTGLNFYVGHIGLAVLPGPQRVVFGGLIGDDPNLPGQTPTEAQLIIHDVNMAEIERQTPIPCLLDTGKLFTTGEPNVVVGLSKGGQLAYRWDIVTKALLGTVDLALFGGVGESTQAPDGSIVAVLGSSLVSIDPLTLSYTVWGDLAETILGVDATHPVTCISTMTGVNTLLLAVGSEVFQVIAA